MTTPRLFGIVLAAVFLGLSASMAGEFLLNGNFESSFYGQGVPAYWKANAGDGNQNLQNATYLSPFRNIYPSGTRSVAFVDGASDSNLPNLLQDFAPSQSKFALSFEFCLDSVSDAPWKFQIGSGSTTLNLAFLINAASSLQFSGATTGTVSALLPATWYQLNATLDDTAGTFSGSLTQFGGSLVAFSGGLIAGGPAVSSYVELRDASANANPTLHLDNVSIRTIPEPSVPCLCSAGLALFFASRRLAYTPPAKIRAL